MMFYIGVTMLLMISVYLIHHVYELMGWQQFKKEILIPSLFFAWVVLALILMVASSFP